MGLCAEQYLRRVAYFDATRFTPADTTPFHKDYLDDSDPLHH
jgi:hypothetical protein